MRREANFADRIRFLSRGHRPGEDEHPVRVGDYARAGIITMPYIRNLDQISKRRVTLIAFPLNIIGVEASPVRAIVIEH